MVHRALIFLERSARRAPRAPAAVDGGQTLSYAELLGRSRAAGSALAEAGCERRPIIIFMEKGCDTLCALLGVLWAGGFYVPIDPSMPAERARHIHEVLGSPPVIVADATREAAGRAFPVASLIDVGALLSHAIDDAELSAVATRVVDTEPAYVLFTSGSTGAPKGVAVSHRAIVDFISEFVDTFGIERSDIIGNQAPFDFDVSVKDIYASMAAGACLVMLERPLFSRPAALIDALRAHRVTTMIWAAAALCLVSGLRGLDYADLPDVRLVMFSGEVMPLKHLRLWQRHLPRARFVNLYGPTEVTCNCLYHVVDRDRAYADGVPLGGPFANRRVLLLDERGRVVDEPGVTGEIYVGGPSLALGYYGDAERTARAFVQNPLQDAVPEILYRTGDRARLSDDGELHFSGRVDNQIKHQGHRIELEEIDATFERQDGVERCRCAYQSRLRQIHAFFEGAADADELRGAVARFLPGPMVPAFIHRVEGMPLTKNGKVDREELLRRGAPPRRIPRKGNDRER